MKKKLIHYGEIFGAAFAVTLIANGQHILDAHGLNAVKSAAVALVVAGAKAGVDALRLALTKPKVA